MRNYKENRKPVNSDQLAKWERSYKIGDIVDISKKYNLSISTVSIAFKGTATTNTIKCINEYYKCVAKGRKIKKVLSLEIART